MLTFALLPWAWFVVRDVQPALDLVAVGLPLLALALLGVAAVASLATRSLRWLVAVASVALFGVVVVGAPWAPRDGPPPEERVVVLTANIAGPEVRGPAEAVVASVVGADPDVVVVDELSPLVATMLAAAFPHHVETFPADELNPEPPAIGVFSQLPIIEAEVEPDGLPLIRAVVDGGPAGRFVLYGAHVPKAVLRPAGFATSFAGHDDIIRAMAAAAADEDLPVVVAGDLNTSDRSSGYRVLARQLEDGARADTWAGPTSAKDSPLWRLLALRIDHVLHSTSWCATDASRVELDGSDHRGVRVSLGPCPP